MQIKKYTASSLKEASGKMKEELGSDAIILSTRVISGSDSYGRNLYEITAGIESASPLPAVNNRQPVNKKTGSQNTFALELERVTKKLKTEKHEVLLSEKSDQLKDILRDKAKKLLVNDVEKQYVSKLLVQLQKYKKFLHPTNIDNYIVSELSSLIETGKLEFKKQNKPMVISVVGPTGVGKTTSIAKLAVIAKILHKLEIGIVTLDTFRLGAIDQLKVFSEISKIDLQVCYDLNDIPKIIKLFKNKDIIFVDTAGRSQKDKKNLIATANYLNHLNPDLTLLALSSTSSIKNLKDTVDKFNIYNYEGIIFTKTDEAAAFGNIINISNYSQKPLYYLSTGQVIPDDIIAADSEIVAKMIYA